MSQKSKDNILPFTLNQVNARDSFQNGFQNSFQSRSLAQTREEDRLSKEIIEEDIAYMDIVEMEEIKLEILNFLQDKATTRSDLIIVALFVELIRKGKDGC